MKYLSLFLLLLTGCSTQIKPVNNLSFYVAEFAKEEHPQFDSTLIDLNGNGKKDAVVWLKGENWCGSAGCTLLIFENMQSSYRFVSKSTITKKPIKVANTASNGWKDIIVWSRRAVLMQFNGEKYPLNPSLEPSPTKQQLLASKLILKTP